MCLFQVLTLDPRKKKKKKLPGMSLEHQNEGLNGPVMASYGQLGQMTWQLLLFPFNLKSSLLFLSSKAMTRKLSRMVKCLGLKVKNCHTPKRRRTNDKGTVKWLAASRVCTWEMLMFFLRFKFFFGKCTNVFQLDPIPLTDSSYVRSYMLVIRHMFLGFMYILHSYMQ